MSITQQQAQELKTLATAALITNYEVGQLRSAAQAVVDRWYNGRFLNEGDECSIVEDLMDKLRAALSADSTSTPQPTATSSRLERRGAG